MDASKITQLLQKQNTRYINRCQTVDASLQTYRNQLSQSKYVKGTPDCFNQSNTLNQYTPGCPGPNGINSFGGNGRSTTLVTGSPQQFPNPLASATGSDGAVYSSDNIMLQRAGKQQCGVPGTNPAPENSYVVLPPCCDLYTNTNYTSNPKIINNNNNPYLPQVDTYYSMKNPTCNQPVQDQNQKHFVKQCHSRNNEMKNGVSVNCTDCQQTPQTCNGCILEPIQVIDTLTGGESKLLVEEITGGKGQLTGGILIGGGSIGGVSIGGGGSIGGGVLIGGGGKLIENNPIWIKTV